MLKKILSGLLVFSMVFTLTACSFKVEIPSYESASATLDITSPETEKATSADGGESETDVPFPKPEKLQGDPFTVCIDAGHGYVDPGSTSDYLGDKWEREIVREYAEKLKSELEAKGVRVIMLWDEDVYVTASEVAAAADKVGVEYNGEKLVDDRRFAAYNRSIWANVLHRETYIDAFVSLHLNTYPADESVKGTRIYYCSDVASSKASGSLCVNLTSALGKTLPTQKVRYYADTASDAFIVTKVPEMPSALIEIGFVTNKAEAKNILDEKWADAFVRGISDGLIAFYG